MVGALIFLQKIRISPDTAFSVNDWTAFVIFITVIGGIGRIEGPIIGTVVFFLLRQTLADLGAIYLLILGVVAIAVMLKAPKGLWGLIADRYGWQVFPLERRLVADARRLQGLRSPGRAHTFCSKNRTSAHDPDPLDGPAGAAPPRRARRAFARSLHAGGSRRGRRPRSSTACSGSTPRRRAASSRSTPTAIRTAGARSPRARARRFSYVSFGAFEDDLPRFRERLETHADRPARPAQGLRDRTGCGSAIPTARWSKSASPRKARPTPRRRSR